MPVPDRVDALCAMGGALYALTGAAPGTGPGTEPAAAVLTLWQAEGGADWRAVATVEAGRGQPFLALDCSGASPGVLLSDVFHLPLEGRAIRLGGAPLGDGPSHVTLQKDGFLYVGADMGDWGGGRWRYALEGKAAGRVEGRGRCGLAGRDCLNVTGLAPDPGDPACVLVAVGLVHFAPSGRVSRLCGKEMSLVYAKPMTVETDWVFAGDLPEKAWPQVAFTGLVMADNEVWAMGTDGLYRFGQAALPDFQGFASFGAFPASGVDWSHPDLVLVSSSATRRHAVNGGALLLVPRRK